MTWVRHDVVLDIRRRINWLAIVIRAGKERDKERKRAFLNRAAQFVLEPNPSEITIAMVRLNFVETPIFAARDLERAEDIIGGAGGLASASDAELKELQAIVKEACRYAHARYPG